MQMKKEDFKSMIKEKARYACFEKMEKLKDSHSKVKHLCYSRDNKAQEYLVSNKVTNKLSKLIFNLRSKCVKEFKSNFPNQYSTSRCTLCGKHEDTQQLALTCEVLAQKKKKLELDSVKYDNLFGSIEDQVKVAQVFLKITKLRENLVTPGAADRGIIPDPETITRV